MHFCRGIHKVVSVGLLYDRSMFGQHDAFIQSTEITIRSTGI